jgi:hypothetical protein
MADFKMKIDPVGQGTVEVDGQDISGDVLGVNFQMQRNTLTEIYLQLLPGSAVEIEGSGIVYVLSKDPVKKFLSGLDPNIVKAMALESLGWGDDDPIVAAVNVIKKLGEEFDADQS